MNILFPMAGQGARFGHRFKPFLTIGDETFIEAAVRPFRRVVNEISQFVFVYLESQERDFQVSDRLARMFSDLPIRSVRLASPTRGPAETIARGIEQSESTGAAFLCDCDHELEVDGLFARATSDARWDAILPVWPLAGENLASWSVAMVESGHVSAIAEKQRPAGGRGTPMGVIGCYGFRDIGKTVERAVSLKATNFSDVLQTMIAGDEIVEAVQIPRARFFGDPERLAKETRGSV